MSFQRKSIQTILFLMLVFISVPVFAVTPTDISKHWAKKDITTANTEGWALVQNAKFLPDKPATREEVAWMLIGACKLVAVPDFSIDKKDNLKGFKDKPSVWAKDRMGIAVANNLIKGYSDKTLRPKASITRAELAVLLSRKITETPPAKITPYHDYIPEWALPGIRKVSFRKIVQGYPNGSFGAEKTVTKAEALVMIKRWKAIMPEKPDPMSKELSSMSTILTKVVKSFDNKSISYYGNNTDKEEIFSVGQGDATSFSFKVNNGITDSEYQALSKALKVILPVGYADVVTETKNIEYLKEKTIKTDERYVNIKCYPMYKTIQITTFEPQPIATPTSEGGL